MCQVCDHKTIQLVTFKVDGSAGRSDSIHNPKKAGGTLKTLYLEKSPNGPILKNLDFSYNVLRKLFARFRVEKVNT